MACFNKYFSGSNAQVDSVQNRPEHGDPLEEDLWKAKEEWDNARNFFNQVADPDLVDYAIFEMEAAERKYMHLLNIIKKEQGYVQEDRENVEEEKKTTIEEDLEVPESSERGGEES